MDICVFCVCLEQFFVGAVSGHHLSSTSRAGYKSFSLVEKCIRCSFKLNTGYPVLFCPIGKILFLSDVLVRMWIQMFECQKILLRQCVSVGPYIHWDMLKCASIIFEVLLKRGWARLNFGVLTWTLSPRIWGLIKPRSMSFPLGFWSWNFFFFIYTQYMIGISGM